MKYVFIFLAFLVGVYACQWAFNHIDAWVGIGLSVGLTLLVINYIINLIKKINKHESNN
jgi:hypothetical protein